jgi:hypothetical protein
LHLAAYFSLHRANNALKGCTVASLRSRLFEIARVLVRFNDIARGIVNANHSIM